jgi:hypothetical protein
MAEAMNGKGVVQSYVITATVNLPEAARGFQQGHFGVSRHQ